MYAFVAAFKAVMFFTAFLTLRRVGLAVPTAAYRTAWGATSYLCLLCALASLVPSQLAVEIGEAATVVVIALIASQRLLKANQTNADLRSQVQGVEAFNRLVMDTAGALVTLTDREGKFVTVNREYQSIIGLQESEFVGRYWWEVVWPAEMHAQAVEMSAETSQENFPYAFDVDVWDTHGNRHVVTWKADAAYDQHGQWVGVLSVGLEVTQQHLSREQLELGEELCRSGSWTYAVETDTVTWTLGVYRLLQRDPLLPPLTSVEFFSRVHEDDIAMVRAAFSSAHDEQVGNLTIFRIQSDTGRRLWVRCKTKVDVGIHGQITIRGMLQDVTER